MTILNNRSKYLKVSTMIFFIWNHVILLIKCIVPVTVRPAAWTSDGFRCIVHWSRTSHLGVVKASVELYIWLVLGDSCVHLVENSQLLLVPRYSRSSLQASRLETGNYHSLRLSSREYTRDENPHCSHEVWYELFVYIYKIFVCIFRRIRYWRIIWEICCSLRLCSTSSLCSRRQSVGYLSIL